MTSASTNLRIHPDYCHNLSPTINKWCPLRVTDVFALKDVGMFCDGRLLYHHGNHPVKWVRLTGVVVAADEYNGRRVYTLDDSSGMCIECTAVARAEAKPAVKVAIPKHLDQLNALSRMGDIAKPSAVTAKESEVKKRDAKWQPSTQEPDVPWGEIDVGAVVKVKGKIGEFRAVKQIEVIKIEMMKGLDTEIKCWNEGMAFRVDVLGKPWVVSGEEDAQCRKDKEKEIRRAKRWKETEEQRRRRKMAEKKQREESEKERARRKREKEAQMRPPPLPLSARKSRSSSLAVRQVAPGIYDALGL